MSSTDHPMAIAAALRNAAAGGGGAPYTAAEIAGALRASGVFPGLPAADLARVLHAPGVFPSLTRAELRAVLAGAGVPAGEVQAAVDAALGELPLLRLVEAKASSQLAAPYNGRPQTAERLIEGPHDRVTFWNSADDGSDPSPWFWVKLEKTAAVRGLTIRWKRENGPTGARAMKYRVLSSVDGSSWAETGVDQRQVPGLSPDLAEDRLPGWDAPTRFIRIEMSNSSYRGDGYFTCYYVLVRGEAL